MNLFLKRVVWIILTSHFDKSFLTECNYQNQNLNVGITRRQTKLVNGSITTYNTSIKRSLERSSSRV